MQKLLIWFCALALVLPLNANAADPPTHEATLKARATTFLVIYRAGTAWVPGKAIRDQPPRSHTHKQDSQIG